MTTSLEQAQIINATLNASPSRCVELRTEGAHTYSITTTCEPSAELEKLLDKLLRVLLGDGVYADDRVASCRKALLAADRMNGGIIAALRERAELAEHRVAGLCAANADCYHIIARQREALGFDEHEKLMLEIRNLECQAIRIVERERDEWKARALAAEKLQHEQMVNENEG